MMIGNIVANASYPGDNVVSQNQSAACNLPISGFEWVELLVSEMSIASKMDDARARASKVLEGLEKSIVTRASAEATQSFLKVGHVSLFNYETYFVVFVNNLFLGLEIL